MPDYTILQVEEQNLRLDTQDGVTGVIRATKKNALLIAYYQRLEDSDKERIHNMIKGNLEFAIEKEFVRAVTHFAEEEVEYIPYHARVARRQYG